MLLFEFTIVVEAGIFYEDEDCDEDACGLMKTADENGAAVEFFVVCNWE